MSQEGFVQRLQGIPRQSLQVPPLLACLPEGLLSLGRAPPLGSRTFLCGLLFGSSNEHNPRLL